MLPTILPFNQLQAVLNALHAELRQALRAVAGWQGRGQHLPRSGGCTLLGIDVSAHPSDRFFTDAPDGSLLIGQVCLRWHPARGWRAAGDRLARFLDALEVAGCDNVKVEVRSVRCKDSGGRLLAGDVRLYCPLPWEPTF
ncbi:MAG: hypothetical protein JNM56_19510 [Planctomycetia bacterium]|nr:hypothetical protein [Planctomycetia bacterium]